MKYFSSPVFSGLAFAFLVSFATSSAHAQVSSCIGTAEPPTIRAEGLTERAGDVVYDCTGVPNTAFTANVTIGLNTAVSNRLSTGSTITGVVFTVDSGSGPQPVTVQPFLFTRNSITFNGVPLVFSPAGKMVLRFAGLRGDATLLPIQSLMIASLSINGAGLLINTPQTIVGTPLRSFYAGFDEKIICSVYGSALPSDINFTRLVQFGTAFGTTRVTEGFADVFGTRNDFNFVNADSGARVIIRYSGFPAGSRLFIPDVVAGSDALQPTSAGALGLPASGGAYAPVLNGTLLLARVNGANSNGAGGSPVYTPGAIGSGTVTFNSVSEIAVSGGSAYAVYEVVDSNLHRIETAQIPTWLGLGVDGDRPATQTDAHVYLAPVSTVGVASASEPLPRFVAVEPPPDCVIVGDCATYLARLSVNASSFEFAGRAGGPTQQSYLLIRNVGGRSMPWNASITYGSGSGWLTLDPTSGVGGVNMRVYADPRGLTAGTYTATLSIDAGAAGSVSIPVTFTVGAAAPAPPSPTVSDVVNGASFTAVPVVPGSVTTVMGSEFAGARVEASFDGLPASILFSNEKQINLVVPAELGAKASASLVVSVDGRGSTPKPVSLAAFAPAIFRGGILNQDYAVNGASNGAEPGSVIQIFATGLSGSGTITAHIHDRDVTVPYYAGPAPGLPGVQQVNLVVPTDLAHVNTEVFVCGTGVGGAKVCSAAAPLSIK